MRFTLSKKRPRVRSANYERGPKNNAQNPTRKVCDAQKSVLRWETPTRKARALRLKVTLFLHLVTYRGGVKRIFQSDFDRIKLTLTNHSVI
jgi:hypothetical protein